MPENEHEHEHEWEPRRHEPAGSWRPEPVSAGLRGLAFGCIYGAIIGALAYRRLCSSRRRRAYQPRRARAGLHGRLRGPGALRARCSAQGTGTLDYAHALKGVYSSVP